MSVTYLIFLSLILSNDPDIRVQNIEGKPFICFTKQDAQDMLQVQTDCTKHQEELKQFRLLFDLKDQEVRHYLTALELRNQQVTSLERRNKDLIAESNKHTDNFGWVYWLAITTIAVVAFGAGAATVLVLH